MTKAALEAIVNTLLAPNQPITANGQHKPSMQQLINEMYDAASRGAVLNGIPDVVSLMSGDKVLLFRSGVAFKVDKDLLGGGGTGVTDGDKTGVQVSGSGTVWLPSDYRNITVSTAGATITLPHNSKYETFFTGLTSFATHKTVVRTGESRTMRWTFMWEITNLAATLNFGSDTRSWSNQFVGGVFTPLDTGAYKVVATRRYDDIWWLDFKGVYSVGDAPPEPDPTTWLLYDDDEPVFYDDDSHVEYDS